MPEPFPWTRDEWLADFAVVEDDASVLAPMPRWVSPWPDMDSDPVACWISRGVWVGVVVGGFILGAVAVLIVRRVLS